MKMHHSMLLYYPGIKRTLILMSHSLHLPLVSNKMTSGSSDEFWKHLKKCTENVNRGNRGRNVSGSERG